MPLAIIELNDTGICLSIDRKIITTSPGFAVLDGDRLLVGKEGMDNSRLLPRWTNNRFWNQLSTDPIAEATPGIRHHADLAFAHLESLWNQADKEIDQAILIVPGFFSNDQLGLLLGMATECGIPVVSLVDSSLVSVCHYPLSETVLHLDASLHRITLSLLRANVQLTRDETATIVESGIFTFWERWANVIADQFIQTSRFDPLHLAISEQKLFDNIPAWIENLETGETGTGISGTGRSHPFNLELADASYSVNIATDQLITACSSIYPKIVQSIRSMIPEQQGAQLYISHRLQAIPGLRDSLALIKNISIHQLTEADLLDAAYHHSKDLMGKGSGISHILKLPVYQGAESPSLSSSLANGEKDADNNKATHLLFGDQAVSIGKVFKLADPREAGLKQDQNPACTIYTQGQDLLLENHIGKDLSVNGNPVTGTAKINRGDVIQIGAADIRLIRVTG